MLRIEVKSPDRVAVLTALDDLKAGQVDQQYERPNIYKIWCVGVEEETLRKRLKKICHHPFDLRPDDPAPKATGGGFGQLPE